MDIHTYKHKHTHAHVTHTHEDMRVDTHMCTHMYTLTHTPGGESFRGSISFGFSRWESPHPTEPRGSSSVPPSSLAWSGVTWGSSGGSRGQADTRVAALYTPRALSLCLLSAPFLPLSRKAKT